MFQSQVCFNDDGCLDCPRCGEGGYLHHGGVEIFNRQEDAKTGTHITVDANGKCEEIEDDLSGNPSRRRDGIVIKFYCENCTDNLDDALNYDLELCVAQHKGQTFMIWREKGSKDCA